MLERTEKRFRDSSSREQLQVTPAKRLGVHQIHQKYNNLHINEKGQSRYEKLVADRLVDASSMSLWDRMEKLILKTRSTCVKKVSVVAGTKVMKLHEDRQLLARFLVIQQSRPNMVDKLGTRSGTARWSHQDHSAIDGTLLIPSDKSSFMKELERYSPPPPSKLGNNHCTTAVCDHAAPIDPSYTVKLTALRCIWEWTCLQKTCQNHHILTETMSSLFVDKLSCKA